MTVEQPNLGRPEDKRLLTGRANYTDDIALDRMVHVAFVRSSLAHASIRGIDAQPALDAGALLVLTAEDLPFIDKTLISRFAHESLRPAMSPMLARERVRFVGEAIALVVAQSRYEAEDVAELVEVDLDPLPAVATFADAMAEGAPQLHDNWPGNIGAQFMHETGNADATMAKAAGRVSQRFTFGRQTGLPLETRGCVADFDAGRDTVTVYVSTQTHYNVRENICFLLGLPENNVRVVAEDVGGGFGSKSRPYAEEVLAAHVSRVLSRPVKWIEDRFEHLQATTHSRSMETELEMGYDGEGRILAMRGRLLVDIGAYSFTSGIVTAEVASGQCAGPYKIPDIALEVFCVGTNKTPLATYRGAGQPEATFPLEMMLDMVAKELGLPPSVVRERNLVAPADMPYAPYVPYGGPKCRFESGDFPALLQKAIDESGYLLETETLETGERTAWGLACGIESTGFVGFESAEVRIDATGKVTVFSGMSTQGQGQPTAYAKVCTETLGADVADITVRMGDTQLLPFGRGAFASRGAVVGANAVAGAAQRLRAKVLGHAGTLLQEKADGLSIERGRIIRGSGDATDLTLGDIAQATMPGAPLYDGSVALSEQYIYDTQQTLTFALSVHAAKVAVDPRTGFYRILDYFIAHDAGRHLDEAIVDGQIIGGAVDGIGCAMLSELLYDADGQLLTGTLADYLVVTAPEAPRIRVAHRHTTPTTNPLGVRGVGEGGTIPAPAALVSAVVRAIDPDGNEAVKFLNHIPLRPEVVFEACKSIGV